MSFAVSGLASGLDTNALISELMFAERATVRRLEASKQRENSALTAWGDIGSQLSELRSSIASIRSGDALGAATAQSSDDTILRATASDGALEGTQTLRVDSLAAAHQLASPGLESGSTLVGAGTASVSAGFAGLGTEVGANTLNAGTYTFTITAVNEATGDLTVVFDGVEQQVSTTPTPIGMGFSVGFTVTAADGGTLSLSTAPDTSVTLGTASITVVETDASTTAVGLASMLNVDGGPIQAQVIDTGDGSTESSRLVLTARATGAANAATVDFSGLSAFAGGLTTLRDASDAQLSLGDGGLVISRPNNTISDLFEGVTLDLVGVSDGQDLELVIGSDIDKRTEAVTAVIESANTILSQLSASTRYDVDAGVGGPLVGSFTARSVASELTTAMGTIVPTGNMVLLSQIGVNIQNDGTYSVDDAKLRDALSSDAVGVGQVLLGDPQIEDDGVLDVLEGTITKLLEESGRIATAKSSAEGNIEELDRSIASQEVRLGAVEDRYRRQFAAMESLLSQLQSQSSYLTSLIGTASQ